MDHPVKTCRDCSKYKPYYTKEYCTFAKMPAGLCVFHKKTVGALSFCDDWSDERVPPYSKKRIAKMKLEKIRRELAELKQIFEEEENDGR